MSESDEPSFIQIPAEQLSTEALQGLIEAFIAREGTDYGEVEWSMAEKRAQVEDAIRRGEAVIVFDPITESCTIAGPDVLR